MTAPTLATAPLDKAFEDEMRELVRAVARTCAEDVYAPLVTTTLNTVTGNVSAAMTTVQALRTEHTAAVKAASQSATMLLQELGDARRDIAGTKAGLTDQVQKVQTVLVSELGAVERRLKDHVRSGEDRLRADATAHAHELTAQLQQLNGMLTSLTNFTRQQADRAAEEARISQGRFRIATALVILVLALQGVSLYLHVR